MFYIYTSHDFSGKGRRDKDILLLMSAIEENQLEYKILPQDLSNITFTKDDYVYLNIGSAFIDTLFDQKTNLKNTKIFPNIKGIADTYNKDVCNKKCLLNNISIPKTYYSKEEIQEKDLPLLFKPVSGSLGNHIKLCETIQEIENQIQSLIEDDHFKNKNYILQEFIKTGSMPIKYRVIFIGQQILVSYKAESKHDKIVCTLGDDLNPILEINPDNQDVLNLARKFIDTVGKDCDFGALDIIQDLKGQCYVLENNGPTKLYRASQGLGINLYQSVLDYMLTK